MKILLILVTLGFLSTSFAGSGGDCPNYWSPSRPVLDRIKDIPVKKISLLEGAELVARPEFRMDMVKDKNDCGQIAWFETRRLEGLLDLYEASDDTEYLEQFIETADRIYKTNDIFHNRVDELRGRVVFGWSSIKYTSNGQRHVHGVQAGIMSEMYSRFSRTVFERKLKKYYSKADEYFAIAERSLEEVMEDWDPKLGFFRFKRGGHPKYSVYPYNQGLTIASAYIEFYQVYKFKKNGEKVKVAEENIEKIGRYFMKTLKKDSVKKRYLWIYAPDAYYQDMSHASLDLNFVMKAYRNNFFFTREDMVLFGNTIEHSYITSKKEYGRYIDGHQLPNYTNWKGLTCLMLTDFNEFNSTIAETCENNVKDIIYNENIIKEMEPQTFGMLTNGLAKLYKVKKASGK